jgi:DNA-binding HxlR family transcriptional regulator
MTSIKEENSNCPAEQLLKILSGKWKPQIFRLASIGAVRFSDLLRNIEGSNKQSIAKALKDLESEGLLERNVVALKPLHIEYVLSERGNKMLPVFHKLEDL